MKIGYARVSTKDQNLSMQIELLENIGCDQIFQEKTSGTKEDRPQLNVLRSILRSGDVVYISKLDRLGRSLKDLISIISSFEKMNVSLVSLHDHIDTTTASGKMFFHMVAALSQYETDIISERTKAGLDAARARGRNGGRKRGLSKDADHKSIVAKSLYDAQKLGVNDIAKQLKISKMTLYKYLRHQGVQIGVRSSAPTI